MVVHSEKKVVREFYVLCNISCVMIVDRRCQKLKEDTIETHTHFICYLSQQAKTKMIYSM